MIRLKTIILLVVFGLLSCKTETDPVATRYFETQIPNGISMPIGLQDMPVKGIELGEMLFFDENLSSNKTVSCASCHHQENGFSEPIALSTNGVSGEVLPRHSPVLFNLAWHNGFFWDGGAPDLESQALGPLFSEHEMDADFEDILIYLKASSYYKGKFQEVFPDQEISSSEVLKALTWFENSLVSFNSKYDGFLSSQDSSVFEASELKGLKIFDAQCQSCHELPLGSTYGYANNELDDAFDYEIEDERLGRNRITDEISDLGKYKIPSVRNVSFTAPYMHDGRFADLDEVLGHYSNAPSTENITVNLKNSDLEDLKSFLYTLNDSSFVKN